MALLSFKGNFVKSAPKADDDDVSQVWLTKFLTDTPVKTGKVSNFLKSQTDLVRYVVSQ